MTRALALVGVLAVGGCSKEYSETSPAPEAAGGGAAVTATGATTATAESWPLRIWMAANLSRPMKAQDLEVLARSLAVVAANAPPELAGWSSIAERGARAAADGDIDRVRIACNDCHEKFRDDYRDRFRSRPFPLHNPP